MSFIKHVEDEILLQKKPYYEHKYLDILVTYTGKHFWFSNSVQITKDISIELKDTCILTMYSYSFGVNPQLAISMFQLCCYISYISLFSNLCWTCSRFFFPPDWTAIFALTHAFLLWTTDWHQINLRRVELGFSSWFSFSFWRGQFWGEGRLVK